MSFVTYIFLFFFSNNVLAQTAVAGKEAKPEHDIFYFIFNLLLGQKGVLAVIGILLFFYTYKNSVKIFAWVDDQTYGTRDYILKKFEIMHIVVEPQKLTYALLFLSFGLSIIIFGVFSIFGKFILGAFVATIIGIIGWKAPRKVVDFMEEKRVAKYQTQMVDGLNLLANGIRAGLSMPQAVGMVVDEMPAPLSQEFNLILQQAKIGVPLDEALENLYKRVSTEDNQMFVSSVNILRESGGNLAEVFDTIVLVIRERLRLRQKIESYVAQGKMQGYTIFAMPFAQIVINISNDENYFTTLFTTPLGIIMFVVICGMSFTGLWVIMKIINIKV